MSKDKVRASITEVLRRAVVESGISYNALERETGVKRASIMRFALGMQSLRLDKADRLAEFFGLALRKTR
jgi:plasmid maintenance system antidote protein VapI